MRARAAAAGLCVFGLVCVRACVGPLSRRVAGDRAGGGEVFLSTTLLPCLARPRTRPGQARFRRTRRRGGAPHTEQETARGRVGGAARRGRGTQYPGGDFFARPARLFAWARFACKRGARPPAARPGAAHPGYAWCATMCVVWGWPGRRAGPVSRLQGEACRRGPSRARAQGPGPSRCSCPVYPPLARRARAGTHLFHAHSGVHGHDQLQERASWGGEGRAAHGEPARSRDKGATPPGEKKRLGRARARPRRLCLRRLLFCGPPGSALSMAGAAVLPRGAGRGRVGMGPPRAVSRP